MATVDKNFRIKNGLIVGDSTNLVNYSSASPSDPFIGQLWIDEPFLYAWSGSAWTLIGDGSSGGPGGSASGTPFNISNTLIARSASGSFQIGSVDFDTASSVSSAIGRMTWDSGEGTISLGLAGGNVNLKVGQEEIVLCYNGTGSTIPKGRVVYISGAQGQRPRISLSSASTESTSSKTFGITAEPIVDGVEGLVCTFGVVDGIDTSNFTEGSALWLSSSSGLMTITPPVAPIHLVFIGYCIKSNAVSGRIFVNPQNGYELQELHNVLIQSASQTHILAYNSASSLWINKGLQEAIKEIDGTNSGIDSDLLDGQEGSYYLDWTNTTNKPDPIIGVNLSGNTNGAASVTLTDLNNGQISITTNTAHAGTASSIAGSLVTGTVSNATNASHSNTASSINWAGVTGTPTTLSGYNISDGLRSSDAASAYIRVTSSAAIVSGYIPVTASQVYLTRNDAQIFYIPITASSSIVANYVPVSGSSAIVASYIPVTASQTYLTRSDANIIYAPLASASLTGTPIAPTAASGTNTQQIATTAFVRTEVSNLIASAPATLDTLNELAAALGNDPNFATSTASAIGQRLLASTASTLYMSIGSTANHATSASSINASLITGTTLPAAIVNSSLTNVGTLGSLTVSGNLTVDTDTLFIDSINNRVGIRTTSPSATLHVNATSTTAPSLTWGANSGQILRNENSELAIGLSNSNPFPLYFQGRTNTNTSRQIVLQPLGGNVGIGGDPSRTFTVVGTASFTGDISAPTHSGLLLGNAMTASSINISSVTGLASNISTFLQTPTSANLAAAVTDESGTAGAVAFTNNPTFTGTLNAQTIDATNGILVEAYTKDNINLRTDGGFFQTSIATTASGWPQTTNSWYHLISSTHSNTGNYYSMQFAGSFYDSNALFYRATNGSGTTSWNQLWHSGNISAASVAWGNVSSKPSPVIGVNLTGVITGAASATLSQLSNGQVSITTNTNVIRNVISSSPTYNLALTDASDLVELNHSSSVILIVPLNSTAAFPVGTKIDILQIGTGQVTASAAAGVTINSSGGRFKLTSQWSAATLIKRGTDAWVLIGDLE